MRTTDILDSINLSLATLKPEFIVYVNFCAQSLKRPSFFCEYVRMLEMTRISHTVYKRRELFQITYFAPTDEYYRSDRLGLYDVADDVMRIFSDGFIKVADRAPKISAVIADATGRESYIELTVEYTERTEEAKKTMENIDSVEKVKNIKINNERGFYDEYSSN